MTFLPCFIKIGVAFTEHLLCPRYQYTCFLFYNPHKYPTRQELVTLQEGWLRGLVLNHYAIIPLAQH